MKRQKFTRFVSILILILLLPVWLWVSFKAAAQPPAAGGDVDSYLPIVQRPLPTLTPTATPIPTNVMLNGNFEAGPTIWEQFSSNGWQLILSSANLPLSPHSGSWAVWLGGDYDESSILSQNVTVPTGNSTLTYWLWIASEDVCGYDVGGVLINDVAVDAFWLCSDNNSGGWISRNVDLDAYAGQTVEVIFAAFTDDSLNSNLFLDDTSLGLTAVAPEPEETGNPPTATELKMQENSDTRVAAPDPESVIRYRELLHEALGGVPE